MDLKRIFRGWVLAILFVAIILVILYKLVNTGPEYKAVNTSQAIAAINSGNVKSVTLTDVDQTIQLTVKSGADAGQNWEASWVGSQGTQLANTLQKEVQSGKLPPSAYNVKVPKSSGFWTLIFSYLPFLIIFLLFMVFLNQMQGGGSRVMNFGKSKAK
ncbi:MAG TPA: ATP-dependent metallopeptidase FtsH/Yme1/Tma family protein, partial [Streptosporangiaceae bacterium]|nr:ATP-dependent metallopeptidase FtsH/Yme1/Tma family protein [Streptosporangiaceae bacterium]